MIGAAGFQRQRTGQRRPIISDARRHRKTIPGIKFGIGQHIGKAHRAKAFQRRIPAPHRAGHGDGENASGWHARTQRPVLGIPAIAQFGITRWRRPGGGRAGGVEGVEFLLLCHPDDHEQIAGDAGAERFDHAQHRRCRHRRVHRIPTLAQDGDPGLGGQRLAGGDHAVARNHLGPALRRPAFGSATGNGGARRFRATCLLRCRWPRQAGQQAQSNYPLHHLTSPPHSGLDFGDAARDAGRHPLRSRSRHQILILNPDALIGGLSVQPRLDGDHRAGRDGL